MTAVTALANLALGVNSFYTYTHPLPTSLLECTRKHIIIS